MSNDNQSTRSRRHNNNDNQQRNVGGLIKKNLAMGSRNCRSTNGGICSFIFLLCLKRS